MAGQHYADRADIEARLTASGFKWAVDRDNSGSASEAEKAAVVDPALDYADNIVDGAIADMVDLDEARPVSNGWLVDRATDIAAYRAATQGGRRVPKVLRDDYDRAIEWLDGARQGSLRIPGLDKATIGTSAGKPRALNVGGGGCGPRRKRKGAKRWPD